MRSLEVGPKAEGEEWVMGLGVGLADQGESGIEGAAKVVPEFEAGADADAGEIEG